MVSGIGFFVYINNAVSKVPFLGFLCVFFAWLCLFPLLLLLLFSRSRNTLTFSCNLSTERFRFNFLLKPRQFFLIWMCSIFIVCKFLILQEPLSFRTCRISSFGICLNIYYLQSIPVFSCSFLYRIEFKFRFLYLLANCTFSTNVVSS